VAISEAVQVKTEKSGSAAPQKATVSPLPTASRTQWRPLEARVHTYFTDAFLFWFDASLKESRSILAPWIPRHPQLTRQIYELQRICNVERREAYQELKAALERISFSPASFQSGAKPDEEGEIELDELTLMEEMVVSRKLLRAKLKADIYERFRDQIYALDARSMMATPLNGGPVSDQSPRLDVMIDTTLQITLGLGSSLELHGAVTGVDLRLILVRENQTVLMAQLALAFKELDSSSH